MVEGIELFVQQLRLACSGPGRIERAQLHVPSVVPPDAGGFRALAWGRRAIQIIGEVKIFSVPRRQTSSTPTVTLYPERHADCAGGDWTGTGDF
jgi:hypothetical protein